MEYRRMKTRLIAMLVAMSLSLVPCWAAEDDKEKEKENNKRPLWEIAALVSISSVGVLALFLPSLLRKRELLKKVGDYGSVHVKGLQHHFTGHQADNILKWKSAGGIDSYADDTQNFLKSRSSW